jgi:hypothetical protein
MKFNPSKCPDCGERIRGSVDVLYGVALVTKPDEDGNCEWAGETEVDWNGQAPTSNSPGTVVVRCLNGHEFEAEMQGM